MLVFVLPIPVLNVCDTHHNWITGHGHEKMQVALESASPALPGVEVFSGWLSP